LTAFHSFTLTTRISSLISGGVRDREGQDGGFEWLGLGGGIGVSGWEASQGIRTSKLRNLCDTGLMKKKKIQSRKRRLLDEGYKVWMKERVLSYSRAS
jgi:hypothetical protein